MAGTISLTKRSVFNISKSQLKEHPYSVQSLLSRACISTSYERAQDPIETREHERDLTIDNMSGVTGFVADTARQGTVKTIEVAEDLIDLAKESMIDSAYDNAKNTTQKMKHTTLVSEADENVVDMSEYIQELSKYADDHHEDHHQRRNQDLKMGWTKFTCAKYLRGSHIFF